MKSFSILLFTLLATIIAADPILDSFQCFDDPKVIYYQNDPEVAVEHLPQVRIMMCGYTSQCALNMVAYLFMKERLGMNVTFYPTNDYDSVWSGAYWDNWNGSLAYPRNYFEWLWQDNMDLNFEFWPTQLVKTNYAGDILFDGKTDYVLNGRIDFGGFVGAYGEESIWLPKYWVDANPNHVVPQEVKDDTDFRQALIDASAYWVDYYNASYYVLTNVTNTTTNVTVEKIVYTPPAFDHPTHARPTVWGSKPTYFMSEYANDLIQNVIPGGMDLNFVTTGTEGSLMAIVKDLYDQRLPFLANIYTIDDNFGTVTNLTTGELQQFEKLAFPRNPDQSMYDPCFVAKQCQNPIGPVMKAANYRLQERYPEAYDYFQGFTMSTRQLNKVVSNYLQIDDVNMSSTHRWLTAACQWLNSSDETVIDTWNVTAWLVDVKRYDCQNGCGFEVASGAVIGGTCDYYTGDCVCDRAELFADLYCQDSCPGLDGPFANGSEYYFLWCSGHGTCDTTTRQCTCDLAYGDEGCGTKYDTYSLAVGLQVIIILLSVILALVCIGCIVWLRMNQSYKTVKALSVDMTTIMTVGLLMIVCSNIALTQVVNSGSCIAWQWLFGLGGILAIMSPLLKAYRVSRVFHGGKMLRAVKITDKMLMATLIKCAVVEGLICIGYSVLHEIFGGTVLYYNDEELRIEGKCNDNALTGYVAMGSYAYFFIMLCALTKYSYGTRRALSVFKESTCAYASSFLSLLCTLIVMVFSMATQDPTFNIAIQSFAIILVVSAVLILFYGTRIYSFFVEPENRNVTDARQATSTASGFSNSVMKPAAVKDDSKSDVKD
eukprot:250157_1